MSFLKVVMFGLLKVGRLVLLSLFGTKHRARNILRRTINMKIVKISEIADKSSDSETRITKVDDGHVCIEYVSSTEESNQEGEITGHVE